MHIDTVVFWTDWRGREHDADATAIYEMRDGKPYITGWTVEAAGDLDYSDDEQIIEQLYEAVEEAVCEESEARAAESYIPAVAA